MTDMYNDDHPQNLLTLIDSAQFPTSKTELVKVAEDNGATQNAIEAFRALPHETYASIKDVNKDLGLINELPGEQNMFSGSREDRIYK